MVVRAGLLDSSVYTAINSLRTGNLILDVAVAAMITAAVTFFSDGRGRMWLSKIVNLFNELCGGTKRVYVRTITHSVSCRNPCGPYGDMKNDSLQKALTLYWAAHGVTFDRRAQVALTSLHDMRLSWHERPDKLNPLQNFRLTWVAPEDEYVNIGNKIHFRSYRHTEDGGQGSKETLVKQVYELTSPDGPERIDALISDALEWYKSELLRQKDDARYLYMMIANERLSLSSKDSGKDEHGIRYKRYKLSDHKSFSSLFFPGKASLLKLLDDFKQRQGKYSIAGFPHKLGLLLHGPPGTGKTSLIKALAQATGRSVISIPLAQIKTNQELMDVMYDLQLRVDGVESHPPLSFSDVIFVIEDVDASSKVVLRRDEARPTSTPMSASTIKQAEDAAAAVGDTALASLLAAGRRQCATAPPVPPPLPGEEDEGPQMGPRPPTMADLMGDLLKPRPDELNLAGILNVLDGVVDTPGRIVIMTSNHPEKLDEALIRPGRIDRQIYLGHLQPPEASEMLKHYFGAELSAAQRARLDAALAPTGRPSSAVTPAMLEQLCARFSTVDELLLEFCGGSAASTAGVTALTGATVEVPQAPPPSRQSSTPDPTVDVFGDKATTMPALVKRQTSGG